MIKSLFWFTLAACAEIAGCFAFWMSLRLGRGPAHLLWGLSALLVFAYALTRIDATSAGRVYADYSAIYLQNSAFDLKWDNVSSKYDSPNGTRMVGTVGLGRSTCPGVALAKTDLSRRDAASEPSLSCFRSSRF